MRRPQGFAALLLAVGILASNAPPGLAGPAADSTAAATPAPLLGLGDLGLVMFTGASLAILGHSDRDLSGQWSAAHSGDGLARFGEHFGNPIYSAPLLGVAYVAGRLAHRPGLSASALRIAGGMASAAILAGGSKFAAGRWRPYESPDDAGRFQPFSAHSAFPSGHATIAFALAAGLDHETRGAWVPCLAYTAATLTAWSRVRDHKHWPTDVAAGAVLGVWASGKFERIARHEWNRRLALQVAPALDPSDGALALGATLQF